MLCTKHSTKALKSPIFALTTQIPNPPYYIYTQVSTYVDVYMKWKRDSYFESIQHIHQSIELKRVISLKNCISRNPNGCIPIYDVSKRGAEFNIPIKVARFVRQYPSIFEEFLGPKYDLPWFRLTPKAVEIDDEEKRVWKESKVELLDRLRKFVLMSKEKLLPLKIVKGMEWYLGLPEGFSDNLEGDLSGVFRLVDMGEGLRGLGVVEDDGGGRVLSVLEKNAIKRGLCSRSGSGEVVIEFPLFPSKGVRLRRKIENWLKEFQKLPYVSPYEDFSGLDPASDMAEKRVVGVLHELLCLFVDHSAERKKLLCLKKYLSVPQKVHKAFERHPHMFYLSFKNKTCTAILKEAYSGKSTIERHPMLKIRKKYMNLMKESEVILKKRRINKPVVNREKRKLDLDLDYEEEDDRSEIAECTL